MYTLKIYWHRHVTDEKNVGGIADETTLFIPADEVHVQGVIVDPETEMSTWPSGSYFDYLHEADRVDNTRDAQVSTRTKQAGRLIEVIRSNKSTWYLASSAWLLGPNGDTIERVAP
jgi:hypothetical protein